MADKMLNDPNEKAAEKSCEHFLKTLPETMKHISWFLCPIGAIQKKFDDTVPKIERLIKEEDWTGWSSTVLDNLHSVYFSIWILFETQLIKKIVYALLIMGSVVLVSVACVFQGDVHIWYFLTPIMIVLGLIIVWLIVLCWRTKTLTKLVNDAFVDHFGKQYGFSAVEELMGKSVDHCIVTNEFCAWMCGCITKNCVFRCFLGEIPKVPNKLKLAIQHYFQLRENEIEQILPRIRKDLKKKKTTAETVWNYLLDHFKAFVGEYSLFDTHEAAPSLTKATYAYKDKNWDRRRAGKSNKDREEILFTLAKEWIYSRYRLGVMSDEDISEFLKAEPDR
jgi:hypothetical protein